MNLTAFEELAVLVIALYVGWQLPSWTEKIVPKTMGTIKISGGLKYAIQFGLAYFAARIGWNRLNLSIDVALTYLRVKKWALAYQMD